MRDHCFPSEVVSGESDQSIVKAAKDRGAACTCCHWYPNNFCPKYSGPRLQDTQGTVARSLSHWCALFTQSPPGLPQELGRGWGWAGALADLLRNAPSSDSAMLCTRRCSDSLTRLVTRMFSSRIYRQGWAAISSVLVLPFPAPPLSV